MALKQYLHMGKERSLDLLRGVCTQIRCLDNQICDMIKESGYVQGAEKLAGISIGKIRS